MLTGTTIFEFRKARYELLESCVVVVKGLGFENPEPIIEACHKRYDKMRKPIMFSINGGVL